MKTVLSRQTIYNDIEVLTRWPGDIPEHDIVAFVFGPDDGLVYETRNQVYDIIEAVRWPLQGW
jgi:hypothetical protein